MQERMSFITTQAAQASFTEIGSGSSRQAIQCPKLVQSAGLTTGYGKGWSFRMDRNHSMEPSKEPVLCGTAISCPAICCAKCRRHSTLEAYKSSDTTQHSTHRAHQSYQSPPYHITTSARHHRAKTHHEPAG